MRQKNQSTEPAVSLAGETEKNQSTEPDVSLAGETEKNQSTEPAVRPAVTKYDRS